MSDSISDVSDGKEQAHEPPNGPVHEPANTDREMISRILSATHQQLMAVQEDAPREQIAARAIQELAQFSNAQVFRVLFESRAEEKRQEKLRAYQCLIRQAFEPLSGDPDDGLGASGLWNTLALIDRAVLDLDAAIAWIEQLTGGSPQKPKWPFLYEVELAYLHYCRLAKRRNDSVYGLDGLFQYQEDHAQCHEILSRINQLYLALDGSEEEVLSAGYAKTYAQFVFGFVLYHLCDQSLLDSQVRLPIDMSQVHLYSHVYVQSTIKVEVLERARLLLKIAAQKGCSLAQVFLYQMSESFYAIQAVYNNHINQLDHNLQEHTEILFAAVVSGNATARELLQATNMRSSSVHLFDCFCKYVQREMQERNRRIQELQAATDCRHGIAKAIEACIVQYL